MQSKSGEHDGVIAFLLPPCYTTSTMKQQPLPQQKSETPQLEDALWIEYDPQQILSTLDSVAGTWANIDTEAMIAQVYTARERGSKTTI